MELILRNARIAGRFDGAPADIGIDAGRIAAIEQRLAATGRELDLEGRLVSPGFAETHIHLDKSRIVERCGEEEGRQANAVKRVAAAKKHFTVADVHARAATTLERCIVNGATHVRTHVEVDPGIGLRGFDGVKALVEEYRWAVDLELCVFPQEGLTNSPGTEELLVHGLRNGARVIGAAPGYDTDHPGQIKRVFALAREFDVDIDMHLDFGNTPDDMDVDLVCDLTEKYHWGGRVAIGHATKLSVAPIDRLLAVAKRLAGAGVAVTVLPATDLFLMGRHQEHSVLRGVVPAHVLVKHGVNCTLSTNNVLNPFTPMGDCSLVRMANLYANTCQVSRRDDLAECLEMITHRPARLLRLDDYGIAVGKPADLVVLDHTEPAGVVAELAPPLYVFKRGRQTVTRRPPELHRPQ
jgi:cytosine deaminase